MSDQTPELEPDEPAVDEPDEPDQYTNEQPVPHDRQDDDDD